MRFDNLFISYKIGLKDIKSGIPFTKLPLYSKIFIIAIINEIIIISFSFIFNKIIFICISIGLLLFSIAVYLKFHFKKDNLAFMLENHDIPYSEKRMNMTIEILRKYNINIENLDSLDMLIAEAEYEKAKFDLFSKFNIKIIIAIITFITTEMIKIFTLMQVIYILVNLIVLISLIGLFFFFIKYIIKDIFSRYYDELIYDLRQIKIFYIKNINQK